jgi:DHA1 family bicyclomycin/chloramphenicol resistance-like MFS transporter
MNPDASSLWRAPRWALAILLACLGMLGPFSIDTYLPAFSGIAASIGATPVQMQQTLSAYLFGFAVMNLFHGALSDSLGRRPVVLWGIVLFTVASAGCAVADGIGVLVFWRAVQGMSAGAGIVVSRAVIRDMFPPADAQRVMSQVTIYFGVAPAIAPMVGGFLFIHVGWHAIFWFLTAVGGLLWLGNYKLLPETLHKSQKQPFNVSNLMRGYWNLASNPRFLMLALASGIPFNGMFLYVLSAPAFLGEILNLPPTRFFWSFALTISGMMLGAFTSGRLAGRIGPADQMRVGFVVMTAISAVNVVANMAFDAHVSWSLLPMPVYAFGWALTAPIVQLLVLDLAPERRGMASSLQSSLASFVNAAVAGVLAPLVMHSALGLAIGAALMMAVGLVAWVLLRRRWPEAAGGARATFRG